MILLSDDRSGFHSHRVVFVVDDQPIIADTIALILNKTTDEFIAISCHSAADAILTAEGIRPDLVLLDVRMPGVEGLEHALALRDKLGCRVLLMSGAMETSGLLEALVGGGAEPFTVLAKPIAPPELLDEIRRILASHAGRRASGDVVAPPLGAAAEARLLEN